MDLPSDFKEALLEANYLAAEGRFLEAERIYRALATPGPHRGIPLEALAQLLLSQQRLDEAQQVLKTLTEHEPDSLHYAGLLASFLDSAGQPAAAIEEYRRLIERQPDAAVAHFNLALLLKQQQQHAAALSAYEAAIEHGIDQQEEVYSNMGVLCSELQDANKAQAMYEKALSINPDYLPALFNLAGHYEELGEKELADAHYERILAIDPGHWESLARLAFAAKVTHEDRSLEDRLLASIAALKDDKRAQEGLYFALGKVYDDLEAYEDAAAAYTAANELGKQRAVPYDPAAAEASFGLLMNIFAPQWLASTSTESTAAPIFICGMYRSGSTLLERMLGSHPAVTAGGELNALAVLVNQHLGRFPQAAAGATRATLQQIADDYVSTVSDLFPDAAVVTDKRPDNFLRLGLIKAIFPACKIIQTRRNLHDNCLSLYFQQFDGAASYACDLRHIAHYYQQQERLFSHWESCFPESICSVDYEKLVKSPEAELRRVLAFIGLEWDPAVLDFQHGDGLVKTASIWQVRQGLHSNSRDRWRNYRGLLENQGLLSGEAEN